MKTTDFIFALFYNCKTAEPIENKSDYTRVKKWVKKSTSLYTSFSVIAVILVVIIAVAVTAVLSKLGGSGLGVMGILWGVVSVAISILTAWGFATMFLNFKLMVGSLLGAGSTGYRAGEQIQTNHVNITPEYGNRYRVTTHTEDQGCALAMIYGFINLFVWAFLCVYVCPFLTFKKIKISKSNLRNFEISNM